MSRGLLRQSLRHCGRHCKIYHGCRIVAPSRVSIGDHVQMDEGVFVFGGEGVEIGHYAHLAFHSSISGGGACVIGDFAGIGAGVRLLTGTERVGGGLTNPTVPREFRTVERGRIEIGAHAMVFTNSVVFPGVVIGEGAVVAAGSVVHHSLKPWRIYAGNPLVQVGNRLAESVRTSARALRALHG